MSEHAIRAWNYNKAFPKRPAISYSNGMVTGCWMIGACFKNPNELYGAYPHGYLERIHAMFPDARKILHIFSGGLTLREAVLVAGWSSYVKVIDAIADETGVAPTSMVAGTLAAEMELVDSKGPEDGRYPTWVGDVAEMPGEWADRFDLILADPPYSPEDCEKYGVKMPNMREVMKELHRVAAPGADLVWLDQKWPQHKKSLWKTWGTIGLVRSTNHRMRLVSFFRVQK